MAKFAIKNRIDWCIKHLHWQKSTILRSWRQPFSIVEQNCKFFVWFYWIRNLRLVFGVRSHGFSAFFVHFHLQIHKIQFLSVIWRWNVALSLTELIHGVKCSLFDAGFNWPLESLLNMFLLAKSSNFGEILVRFLLCLWFSFTWFVNSKEIKIGSTK